MIVLNWMYIDLERDSVKNDYGVQKRTCSQTYMSIFQTCLNLIIKVVLVVIDLKGIEGTFI